jgi:hypothetical protein
LRRQPAGGEQPACLARVGVRKAQAERRAGEPREQRALDAAAEVERDVPPARTQAADEWRDGAPPVAPLEHERLVEPGMPFQHGRRWRLDHPAEVGVGPAPPNAPEQRQRPHHVTDRTGQDDQGAHGASTAVA